MSGLQVNLTVWSDRLSFVHHM